MMRSHIRSARHTRYALTALALVCLQGAALSAAGQDGAEPIRILGRGVHIACAQPAPEQLGCDYRLPTPSKIQRVEANLAGHAIPVIQNEQRNPAAGVSAVLFLIDTSDPGRKVAVEHGVSHVRKLIAGGSDQHQFGFATFDSNLRMVSPVGSDPREILTALDGVHAVGRTTELYRNALESVQLLAAYPADRRALFLFSDGLAEDRAYYHEDVVRAALRGGVVIYGFGYPRSVSLSVGLQSLRRLATETGGAFFATDAGFELPAGVFETPFAALDNGGFVRFDLSGVFDVEDLGATPAVQLTFTTEGATANVDVPVTIPVRAVEPIVKVVEVEVPKVVEVPTIVEVPVAREPAPPAPGVTATTAQSAAPVAQPVTLAGDPAARYAAATVLGLLLLLLGLVALLLRSRRRETTTEAPESGRQAVRTFAALEHTDGSEQRHPISSAAYRIGRHADNDLTLRDPSISRYHAEIRRSRDGRFTLIDLDSLNGVFVNNKKQKSCVLGDGDSVEIGDVSMKFHVQLHEEVGDEETVVLKTVMPMTPAGDEKERRA